MLLSKESLKFPQIDAAFRYIYDNPNRYATLLNAPYTDILEFGVGSGRSLKKIVDYFKQLNCQHPVIHGYDSWRGLPAEKAGLEHFSKFTPGSYIYDMPDETTLRQLWSFTNLFLYRVEFNDLSDIHRLYLDLNALLIHIDCDLYISTQQALDWCFKNKIVKSHTLIAFDEYSSTDNISGEQLAWWEIQNKYNVDTEMIWWNKYIDKDTGKKITQNVWEVLAIGDSND